MYGDTANIRRLARDMRDQAAGLRRQADALVRHADGVDWQGTAAEAMRRRMRERAHHLRGTASSHDEAARSLEQHAAEVDRLKSLIAAIERRVHSLVAGAKERLASLADKIMDGVKDLAPDPVDEMLDRFVPPPPGHKDWLDVDLPGLHR